jgi:phosphatidylserine/phosphatidylglycerophosphate/cardiolipin synthase-like enzyme
MFFCYTSYPCILGAHHATYPFADPPAPLPASKIQVAFSPRGSATDLIVQTIASAQHSIVVAAYSFTSKPIASALLDAHRRGVDVKVVVDSSQQSEKYTSATFLAHSGIPVRVDHQHGIQHNKYMVIDAQHIETGSFNYSGAAKTSNAENVMVIRHHPALAARYLDDWTTHWQHAVEYTQAGDRN